MLRTVAVFSLLLLLLPTQVLSQVEQHSDMSTHALAPCEPSPTPGKRPSGSDCALLIQKRFVALPSRDLVLRIENFATIDGAKAAATPASVVVEAVGKVWLLTLSAKGLRSHGGQFVTEVGPVPPLRSELRHGRRRGGSWTC
jgi:hypothetical protein